MKKFTELLEKYLSPLGAKLGNQRHLQALSNGMMMTLPPVSYTHLTLPTN